MDTKLSKLCASFSFISFDKTTSQLKKSMKMFEKEFKRTQRYGVWFITSNIDSHSIECELVVFINIRVMRPRYTEWISYLTRSVLTLVSLLSPQEVTYNTTFYASPVVLVSAHHHYNRQNKQNVPPENNIVTAWVEVRKTCIFNHFTSVIINNDQRKCT